MSSTRSYVSLDTLQHTGYAMVATTTAFVLLRAGIQVGRRKSMEIQDCLFYAAYAFYIAVCALYLSMSSRLFKFTDVTAGKAQPWKTMQRDVVVLFNVLFITTLLFWTCLWCAKLSLLVLYRKLMEGLPSTYIRIWWGILVFCVLSWMGCIVSGIVSCTDLHAFFTSGKCGTKADVRAQVASLYFAFAVDVVSDFMILFLPMKLTWNLNMPRPRKYGVRILFGTGLICILFATIRVIQIGSRTDGGNTQPDPAWLMLWTMLESSIAVIIACSPAFAGLYRKAKDSRLRNSYDARGYVKQESNGLDELRSAVKLQRMVVAERSSQTDVLWQDDRNSQEQLTRGRKDITVTTTFQRADSRTGMAC